MSKPKTDHRIDVPESIIKELLTESEWRMVKQRLIIINLLKEGLSMRKIAERVKVGTDTVVRVSKKLEKSQSLKKLYSSGLKQVSPSKWVFGQVGAEKD